MQRVAVQPGSRVRRADHPVDPLFIDRWSPRAMTGEPLSEKTLMTLFEAARWAPSSYNNQPWRFVYARRDTPSWPTFVGLLVDNNRAWAQKAAALIVVASKETFDHNGKPSPTHSFDTGAAWANLALQGWKEGLVVHGMQGFDYGRATSELGIPDGYRVEAMIAVGLPGDPAELPEAMREKEKPNDRKPLSATVSEGTFRS